MWHNHGTTLRGARITHVPHERAGIIDMTLVVLKSSFHPDGAYRRIFALRVSPPLHPDGA